MLDVVERWEQTAALFSQRLAAVRPEQWALPSPCSEWDVRQLVDHAVGVQARFGGMLGLTATTVAWDTLRPALSARFSAPGTLEMSVDMPGLGRFSGAQVVEICVNDLLIHTWDLARSVGGDEALPEPLAAACLAWLETLPEEVLRGGRYADAQPIPEGSGAQARMLAFAGRRP
jgi:uncharacterized protein (TIGR03086 family)